MLFPTITFAIFFLIVFPVSWLLMPTTRLRWKLFLLAASYYFYAYWNWRFAFLLAGSTIANEVFAKALQRTQDDHRRRALLTAAVVVNLGVLGFFKYFDFFTGSARDFLSSFGIHVSPNILAVVLPIGISFFTFQALSYVIDVFRRTFVPVNLVDFAVYLSFFPHVVAGPIVRAAEFLPQLRLRHDPRRVDLSRACFLIFGGLFKKVVIANFLATRIVDTVFASPRQHGSLEVLVGVYAYAVQIYADFSGYTDMAIGLALLLGFQFPQNFDGPYTATSIGDFWHRWHMTLSRWLRDYLYIPLGGSRNGRQATYRNLMLTFLLGGLWHGAAWTFVAWGALHGTYMVVEHARHDRRVELGIPPPPDTGLRRAGRRILTFQLVCFAWIFFRAESLSNAAQVIGRILDPTHWGDPAPLVTGWVILAIVIGIGSQYVPRGVLERAMVWFSLRPPVAQGVMLGFVLLVTNTLGPRGVAPFIYFQF